MRKTIGLVVMLALASVALAAGPRVGQRPEDKRPTFIAAIQGVNGGHPDVKIRALGEDEFRPAQVGQQLLEGCSVWTEPGSMARLAVGGAAIMHLAPGTLVTFVASKENYPVLCRAHVEEGTVWTTVQPGHPFTVEAANASGRAKGTQFRTTFDASTRDSEWEMLEGKLDLYRLPSNHLEHLSAGQRMTVGPNGVPRGATPIQLASVADARGLFSQTLGGAQPPSSGSVSTQAAPTGTVVVFLVRPPGGFPPPITLGAGATGVSTIRPPSFGAVIAQPAVPIRGIGVLTGINTGAVSGKTSPFLGTVRGSDVVRISQPVVPAGGSVNTGGSFNDGGLINIVGQNNAPIVKSNDLNKGIGVRDVGRGTNVIRTAPMQQNFGGQFGGAHQLGGRSFGGRR